MNKKYIPHIIGLMLELIALIPGMPAFLRIILALLPLLFFSGDLALSYLRRFSKKDYINEYIGSLITVFLTILSGKLVHAAICATLFSAAFAIFKEAYSKAQKRVDEYCKILPKKASIFTPERIKNIPVTHLKAGDTVALKEGDIIPCDGYVLQGSATVDYTNLFGSTEPMHIAAGTSCYSGGIVQDGALTLKASGDAVSSLAFVMEEKTRKAHRMSHTHDKLLGFSKLFQPAFTAFGFLLFVIFVIASGKYGYSMNLFAVVSVASSTLIITKILPLLYHVFLLNARRNGVMFTSTESIEKLARIQTVTPCEGVMAEDLKKFEEINVVATRNGSDAIDAKLYRNKALLEADPSPAYKIALGFFSKKADAQVFDAKAKKAAKGVRIAKAMRSIFYENLGILVIAKLLIIALMFFLKITPAIALIIEFASWMICLVNTTKKI